MEAITSSQNPRFKKALRLQRSRGRQQQGRILVYGMREVLRAVRAGVVFQEVMVESSRFNSEDLKALGAVFKKSPPGFFSLTEPLFAKLAYGDRPDGVLGIANRPSTEIEAIEPRENSFVVVLESIEKPGNLGAIARSADGSGAAAILVADQKTDVFHPNAIRSSVSSVFSVPLACASSNEVSDWLRRNGYEILIATPEAEESIYDVELPNRVAFVFGNEAQGLSEVWRSSKHRSVKLPMLGIADSLNVSVTASLMMYESRRQIDLSAGERHKTAVD